MSMISAQIDELRKLADGQAPYRDARAVMLQAADTIWELRDDLQRANSENVRLKQELETVGTAAYMYGQADLATENAKLRELCRRFSEYVSHDRCEGCVVKRQCNDGDVDECWQIDEIRKLARELGVEVDQ